MTEITVTWGDHNNLCVMFEKLFEESVLVDCTLAAEGKYVKAHKTILSAFSPFLQLLFTQESEKNPIVILTHIKFQELKAMIDLIYRGKVKVSEEYLDDFLRAAESLQIKGLERDYIKDQKRNGTAMIIAQELPNHVSHIPSNQHQVNKVSGNETCGTAILSSLDANMDFEGLSADSSQMDHLNSCRINQSSTSVNVVDDSIPSRFTHRECELKSISSANSLFLETDTKCEPTSEEEIEKMEFVQCKEECVEEDAPYCYSPTETSTSPSRLVTARGLPTDSLGSCEPNQCTSSARDLDNSDQNLLGPVSSQQRQGDGEHFLSVSTFSCTSFTNERQEKNTVDLMPRIEFTESSKEFVTEGSALVLESYTSETVGAAAEDVEAEAEAEAEGAPSLACVECGEVFGDASQLRKHARTHTGVGPLTCPVCGKNMKHLSLLTRHLRTHTGDRPFSCHLCSKSFPRSDTLKDHMRTHTGERPYPCHLCGKAFRKAIVLKEHLRTHTGERPFACHVCGKAFHQAYPLTVHLRTHTGERPYSCLTCGRAFRTSSALRYHLRTQHSGQRPGPAPRASSSGPS